MGYWLTGDALTSRLKEGAAVAFDTNVLHQWAQLVKVGSKSKGANAALAQLWRPRIAAVVPVLCLAELVLHQRPALDRLALP